MPLDEEDVPAAPLDAPETEEAPSADAVPGAGNDPAPKADPDPEADDAPGDLLDLDDPPAEDDDDALGDDAEPLIGKDGKILGKFNSVPALAKSYKEATAQMSRRANEAAEYRKALEAQGFTFDDKGKPVAPVAAAPAPEPVDAPDPNAEPPGFTDANGVQYDYLGMPVMSEDDWEQIEADCENQTEYLLLRTKFQGRRDALQFQWQEKQAQERQKTQTTQFETAKQTIRQAAEKDMGLETDLIDQIEAERDKIMATVAPQYRMDPFALQMATDRAAAIIMPGYYKARLGQAVTGTAEAVQRQQKVVRSERGSAAAPPAPAPSKANGLTNEQKRFAREMGVSEEQYAANL